MRFVIYILDNKVKVYDDKREVYLKFEGEEEFPFFSDFWEWFRDKIEYNDEEISFIIVANEEIKIPSFFRLANESGFKKIPKFLLSAKNSKVFSYPPIKEKIEIKQVEKNSIFEYFLEKSIKKKGNNER